ncbi:MAG: tetratricopeptide repeat protein [Planctomycetes bacterium]|nr:tetratricopeptide repeat protein [Planctomycetota bacterium]
MDCRASLLLGLGLLAGTAGCTPTSAFVKPGETQGVEAEKPAETKKLAKRKPSAEACVTFGDFLLKEVRGGKRSEIEQRQMLDQARRAYQQALEINPKCVPAHRGLAQVYLAEGDCERAFTSYQASLKVFPREPLLWYDLGMAYGRNKEWQPAVDALTKACDLAPDDRHYVHALGYCLARAGAYDQSVDCFRRVDGEARAHYNVARMLLQMNQTELGRQHLQVALKIEPELKEAKEELARAEAGRGSGNAVVPVQFEQQR